LEWHQDAEFDLSQDFGALAEIGHRRSPADEQFPIKTTLMTEQFDLTDEEKRALIGCCARRSITPATRWRRSIHRRLNPNHGRPYRRAWHRRMGAAAGDNEPL
jgi:hypothetical protein